MHTWLTELSVKSMSSSTGAAVSRDLKNFFGFGAPAMTAFVEEPRFRSELEPTPMPMDVVDEGLIDEKLPHFPTTPEDFEVTAGRHRRITFYIHPGYSLKIIWHLKMALIFD
jgi:hypothetical protein